MNLTKKWLLAEAMDLYTEHQKRLRAREKADERRATTDIVLPVLSFRVGDSYEEDEASAGRMTPIKMDIVAKNGDKEERVEAVGVFCHRTGTCDISSPQVAELREFAASFAEFFIKEVMPTYEISMTNHRLWDELPE